MAKSFSQRGKTKVQKKGSQSSTFTVGPWIFDMICLTWVGIWIFGGIQYQGQHYLRHGADARRVAIILAVLGYLCSPLLRRESLFLRIFLKIPEMLERPLIRRLTCFCILILASWIAVSQTLALRVRLYDVGIFHQILWSISNGFNFHSTISGAGNFLLDHFSPTLVLLVPLFQISGESPFFLPLLQVVLLFGGASAWIYLSARFPEIDSQFRSKLAAASCVFVMSFDSLWGNLTWGFHENALGFFCISWALALFLAQDNPKINRVHSKIKKTIVFILLLIAAGSKEILLLNVSILMVTWAVLEIKPQLKKLIFPTFLSVVAVALIFIFIRFETIPHPADKNYFARYYSYLGNSLGQFVESLLFSPQRVIEAVGGRELFRYFLTVGLPWIFLPFVIPILIIKKRIPYVQGRYEWILALLPSFGSALLATFPPLRNSNYHYVLELWPLLAVITLGALAALRSTQLIWIWALFSLLRMDFDPIGSLREYQQSLNSENEAVRNELQKIPKDSKVIADELTGTWVAGRSWISRWPDHQLIPLQCPDYFILRNVGTEIKEQDIEKVLAECKVKDKSISLLWSKGVWKGFQVSYTSRK